MFDLSFFELLVVAIVGLIVIGPERLPGTVRTCALWIGRIKRSLMEPRREIEKQIGADDIRRELHNEQVLHNLEKMKDTRLELEERVRKLTSGELLNEGDSNTAPPTAEDSAPESPHSDTTSPTSTTGDQEAQHTAANPPKH